LRQIVLMTPVKSIFIIFELNMASINVVIVVDDGTSITILLKNSQNRTRDSRKKIKYVSQSAF
jgi:hypothetical protein